MLDTPNDMFREAFKDTVAMALCFEAVNRGLGFISVKRGGWCVLIKLFDTADLDKLIASGEFFEYSRALEVLDSLPNARGKFVYSEYSKTVIHNAEQMVAELKSIPLDYEVEYVNVRHFHKE